MTAWFWLALLFASHWTGHLQSTASPESAQPPGPSIKQDVFPYALLRYKAEAVEHTRIPEPHYPTPVCLGVLCPAPPGREVFPGIPMEAPDGRDPLYLHMSLQR
jgi:hypothetical protein